MAGLDLQIRPQRPNKLGYAKLYVLRVCKLSHTTVNLLNSNNVIFFNIITFQLVCVYLTCDLLTHTHSELREPG